MEKKINVAELLKNCPQGMELDCATYENVVFDYVDDTNDTFPIKCHIKLPDNKCSICSFTIYGGVSLHTHAKCVIFPKGKTTWEGFVPPCKFKDGDVISDSIGICIFKGEGKIKGTVDYYCGIPFQDFKIKNLNVKNNKQNPDEHYGYIANYKFATEEEKEKLFQAIKDNNYRWDEETKTLKKLIEPKFKVGDRIIHKIHSTHPFVITEITEQFYKGGTQYEILIEQQDNFVLVPSKFDINTLIPFESKVLVRDDDVERWRPTFWGFYDNDDEVNYPYECVGDAFAQCIPYEGNEHLRGTNNKCDDFYKTWE